MSNKMQGITTGGRSMRIFDYHGKKNISGERVRAARKKKKKQGMNSYE